MNRINFNSNLNNENNQTHNAECKVLLYSRLDYFHMK